MLTDTGRVHSNGVTRETRRMSPMDFIVRQMEAAKHAVSAKADREMLAVEAMKSGVSARSASARYSVPYARVCALRLQHGMGKPATHPVKITPEVLAGIRAMLLDRATHKEIIARYGVCSETITRIRVAAGIVGRVKGSTARSERMRKSEEDVC